MSHVMRSLRDRNTSTYISDSGGRVDAGEFVFLVAKMKIALEKMNRIADI